MKINNKIIEKHGLKPEEFKSIKELLKRDPNILELGILQCGMSTAHINLQEFIKKLPTKGKQVIQGQEKMLE